MKIGVIGIGNMGLGMALRLRDAGREVAVRDVDAAREALAEGCLVMPSAAALAARCELVIVCVVDAAQSEQVLFASDGVVAAGHAVAGDGHSPRCVMLCPTLGVAAVEDFAARLAAAGFAVIDAPMSGGPLRARDGSMSLMVACAQSHFERWHAVLQTLATRLFHVSEKPGDGARTKLVNNLLAAVNLAGAAEAMALAERLGLGAAQTLAVIEQSSGQSWIASDRMRRAIVAAHAGEAVPQAHMALLAKDSALALIEAEAAGFAAPVGRAAAAHFAAAVAAGLAGADDSALWRFVAGSVPQCHVGLKAIRSR